MDRGLVYQGQIPLEEDFLFPQRSAMVGLGKLSEALFGAGRSVIDGLEVSPTTPASLAVRVSPGQIYSVAALDALPYGALGEDASHGVVKQGLSLDPVTLPLTAPATAGFQQYYLVQAAFQERDGGQVVLPYYNVANPLEQFAGPNNSGELQYTRRFGGVLLQLKAGSPAAAGAAPQPTLDAGYVALAYVLVSAGQANVQVIHINRVTSTLRLDLKLPQIARALGARERVVTTSTATLTDADIGLVVIDHSVATGGSTVTLPRADALGIPYRITIKAEFRGSTGSRLNPGSTVQPAVGDVIADTRFGMSGNYQIALSTTDYVTLFSDGVSRWTVGPNRRFRHIAVSTTSTPSQTIASGLETAVVFQVWQDAQARGWLGASFNGVAPANLIVPYDWVALRMSVQAFVHGGAQATAWSWSAIAYINGSTPVAIATQYVPANADVSSAETWGGQFLAFRGDTIQLRVLQNSGVARGVTASVFLEVL